MHFSAEQYECARLNHGPEPAPGKVSVVGPDVLRESASLGGQMEEPRLRAVKWSLFHRPLAAARLMAELSAYLPNYVLEKRRALTDNRCRAGRLFVERLRRDKRRYKAGHRIRGYDQTPADLADSRWIYHRIKAG